MSAFDTPHASYRACKDFEDTLPPATSDEDETRFDAAVDATDAAFKAMISVETVDPKVLAVKLAALEEYYDLFCCGLDRKIGAKLVADIIGALNRQQVSA